MNKAIISIGKTRAFSSLFVDYIEDPGKLSQFFKYSLNRSSFTAAISDKGTETIDRQLLVSVLTDQYANSVTTSVVKSNLNLLAQPTTFTVCTGHQLCLFTGPLYFIYKIITTINLAEELKKLYPACNFVPVYWMASEDHDFEEINHIHLFGKKLVWEPDLSADPQAPSGNPQAPSGNPQAPSGNPQAPSGNPQAPAGGIATNTLDRVFAELIPLLGESENAKALLALLKRAYLEHTNMSDATRYLVNELFGAYGLVILDPNNPKLKKQFASFVKDDLLNQTNYKAVNATIEQLKGLNFPAQVKPRECNFFYIKNGKRKRLILANASSLIEEKEIRLSDGILEEIEAHPEYFSPNVVTRPLYQQKILPNLAYVGGPGEIAYWLEYKAMFEHHKLNFPVLIPRNFLVLVDSKTSRQWAKLGFDTADYFSELDVLTRNYVSKNAAGKMSLADEQEQLQKIYSTITALAERVDTTLKGAALAEQKKAIDGLKTIEAKMVKAEKQKNETVMLQIKKAKEKLFPAGELQERHDNFIPCFLQYGAGFIELLKKEMNPFDYGMIVLAE